MTLEKICIGHYWIHPAVVIKKSAIEGNGLFATQEIKKEQTIMVWEGQLFTKTEILLGYAKPNSVTGYNGEHFLGQAIDEPDTLDQYLNHSCDPNLWMMDEITIASRRDIQAGEELTADYAMWETELTWKLPQPCNCGSAQCRGIITGNDWKLIDLQKDYRNHFLPCINKRVQKINTAQIPYLTDPYPQDSGVDYIILNNG